MKARYVLVYDSEISKDPEKIMVVYNRLLYAGIAPIIAPNLHDTSGSEPARIKDNFVENIPDFDVLIIAHKRSNAAEEYPLSAVANAIIEKVNNNPKYQIEYLHYYY